MRHSCPDAKDTLRSNCGGQWWGTHRTRPSSHTSAANCSTRRGWGHQSTRKTCAQVEHHLDPQGGRCEGSEFLGHPLIDPCKREVPPDKTTLADKTALAYESFRISASHSMLARKVVSWTPLASSPMKLGRENTSGRWKRSLPTVMEFPSGYSYVLPLPEDTVAAFISVSRSSALYESFSFTLRTLASGEGITALRDHRPHVLRRSRPGQTEHKIAWGRA